MIDSWSATTVVLGMKMYSRMWSPPLSRKFSTAFLPQRAALY